MTITIKVTKRPIRLSADGLWQAESEYRTIDRGYIVRASGHGVTKREAVQEAVADLFNRMDYYGE